MLIRSIGLAVLASAVLASGGCSLRSVSIGADDDHHYRHRPVHVTLVETHGGHGHGSHHGDHSKTKIKIKRHGF